MACTSAPTLDGMATSDLPTWTVRSPAKAKVAGTAVATL
ncbi:Uncharacterised protein [Mycobacterium tuberculosis]|nr:Uncharacterised protein [Mycobacterium tuberculosis]